MKCYKRGVKKFVSMLTAVVLLVSGDPYTVRAQESAKRVYEHEGYEITYSITDKWSSNRTVNVNINNTTDEDLCGWAISFVPGGDIYNIWDSQIVKFEAEADSDEDSENSAKEYIIKSKDYNGRIPAGGSVGFGFQMTSECDDLPEDVSLCTGKETLSEEDYDVSMNINSDWQTGVVGEIILRNTGDKDLYFWDLAFNSNVNINNVWNAKLSGEQTEDNSYHLKACDDTSVIKLGREVKIGFNASKDADIQPEIEVVSLAHTTINRDPSGKEKDNGTGNNNKKDEEKDYYEKIAEVMQRYDESTFDRDTDEDGLKDYEEEIIGTDLNNQDTDGDLLSDYDEVYKTYTDPLVYDSAIPGCSDADFDSDGDGLSNIVEIGLNINPQSADTDNDGLSDNEEIKTHGTDPNLIDTDRDGVEDNYELILGLDPLKKDTDGDGVEDGDTLITQEKEEVFEDDEYMERVHVKAKATNLFPEMTSITQNAGVLNEDFERVGALGTPVEISTLSDIDTARIEFYLREGININDYVILWFDDENSRFMECETEYDEVNRVISTNTTHFSIYFPALKKKWNNALDELKMKPQGDFETMIVFDLSKSMAGSDPVYADFTYGLRTSKKRKDVGGAFFVLADKTNRQGAVFFNNNGSVVARLGSTKSELDNTIKMLDIYADGYNTNIRKALSVALDELLENGEDNALKSIVLISDGGTECEGDVLSYDRDVLERAQKADVKIYTVAVGSNPATENLKEIAETTDGLEFTSTVNNAVTIANTVFSHRTENYFKTKPANLIKRKYILGSWQYLIDLKKRVQDCFPEGNPNYLMIAKKQIQLMMQDYYDYAKLDDPENIVDEIWDDYCTEFNNAVRGYGFVEEDVHYFRNKLNRAPATRDELIADKKSWILLGIGDSLYHMHGSDDALFNTKFISNDKDGKYECVYDKEGVLLTEGNDPQNMGTYNYYGPSLDRLIHAYFDVIPYYRWGNIEGCPAVESRNPNDFYSNFEAQEAYKKIENMMK